MKRYHAESMKGMGSDPGMTRMGGRKNNGTDSRVGIGKRMVSWGKIFVEVFECVSRECNGCLTAKG